MWVSRIQICISRIHHWPQRSAYGPGQSHCHHQSAHFHNSYGTLVIFRIGKLLTDNHLGLQHHSVNAYRLKWNVTANQASECLKEAFTLIPILKHADASQTAVDILQVRIPTQWDFWEILIALNVPRHPKVHLLLFHWNPSQSTLQAAHRNTTHSIYTT